jgi:CRP/FNR family transcriptional activator FtrB
VKKTAARLIRIVPSFAKLPPGTIEYLLRHMSIEELPSKTVVLHEGQVADSLCVLAKGLVQLFTSLGKSEATVLVLHPVTAFGVDAVLRNSVLLTSARTVRTCRIVRIPADSVRELVEQSQEFRHVVMNDLTLSHENVVRELKNMRLRTAFQRLVAWILAMQAQAGTSSEIELPYDKSLLAARLGMSPETLSRDLARLTDLGVTVRGRRLTISDSNTLSLSVAVDELSRPSVP